MECSPTKVDVGTEVNFAPTLSMAVAVIEELSPSQQVVLLSDLFQKVCRTYDECIGSDFLELIVKASRHLMQCGRSNVIYKLARAIGTMRLDNTDSRLPAKRMPMGMLEYIANFYDAENYRTVFLPMLLYLLATWIVNTDWSMSL